MNDYVNYMQSHPHTVSIENNNGIIIWRKNAVSDSLFTIIDYEVDVANQIARAIGMTFRNNSYQLKS